MTIRAHAVNSGCAPGRTHREPTRRHRAKRSSTSSPRWNCGLNGRICCIRRSTQFLRTADRQRRNIVNRLVRIQLRALPADDLQGIEHMRLDAEQTQLEHLEQAARSGTDNGNRRSRLTRLAFVRRKRIHGSRKSRQARPALASVGVWKYSLSAASWSTRRFSSAMRPSAVLIGMQSWQRGSPQG